MRGGGLGASSVEIARLVHLALAIDATRVPVAALTNGPGQFIGPDLSD